MKSVKMTYKGFEFDINPSSVKLELSKANSSFVIPFKRNKSREISELPMTLIGKGRLSGADAREKSQELISVFKKSGSAYVFSPVLTPIKAYFTSLEFGVSAGDDSIEYSFKFTEDTGSKKAMYDFGYTLAERGENLFDIANRTDTSVERLFELNRFENPFTVEEGNKVWLK